MKKLMLILVLLLPVVVCGQSVNNVWAIRILWDPGVTDDSVWIDNGILYMTKPDSTLANRIHLTNDLIVEGKVSVDSINTSDVPLLINGTWVYVDTATAWKAVMTRDSTYEVAWLVAGDTVWAYRGIIPSATAPTTDAAGEIAWDSDDEALEIYSEDETESALIPLKQQISCVVEAPDGIADTVLIFHVDAAIYPHGIEIDQVSVCTQYSSSYSLQLQEWSSTPAYQNVVSTVATSSSTYAEEAPDTDGNLDADDWLAILLPATEVDRVSIQVIYHVTEGD